MVKVPLLDLRVQYLSIRDEVRQAIDRVCDAQQFILGPEVAALEHEVATHCEAQFGVGVSSGTDALMVALMALQVGPGDEVITSPYSFFATAGVIARLGATPVFVDIETHSFNMCVDSVRDKVTTRTKAIMPVHLFGRCARLAPLLEVAREKRIAIVEDAAQAIGARDSEGRSAGTVGGMGCFSFFPSKNLGAFGDGGMVVTNDKSLAETLRILRVHGSKPKYHHKIVGGNFRLDALQAAILRVKLKHLPFWSQARRHNADLYRRHFCNASVCPAVVMPEDVPGHIYNQFVIRVSERDHLRAFLEEHGIDTEIYYPRPLHLQECFKNLGYREGDFPEAEKAANDSLALPIYPELTEVQIVHVVDCIKEFYGNRLHGNT